MMALALMASMMIQAGGASTASPGINPSPSAPASPPVTLWLKQLTLSFPADADDAAKKAIVQRFGVATRSIDTCAAADRIAADQRAQVIENRDVALTSLPAGLQQALLSTPTGKATMPFGNLGQGVRVMVVCDRH